ncbi:type II secretion system protein [Methylophilus sp. Q8]|uniref:type II secretion system protein n=1 Tax=Methylophilus sp. Q8 TaxID=1506586 RepID=UPI000648D077|nr:type II secretion system protein [Methylophilus sp. Q8]
MKKISHTQSGFTLIEMIVVMLILSALAVTAYARISQIDTQARLAALQSFKATVLSVATMAKGVCMSDPQCDGNQTTPSAVIAGNTIYFSHGYPVGWLGNEDGVGSLSQLVDAGKFSVQAALSDTNRATYTLQGARDSNHCKLEYIISTGSANTAGLSVSIDSTGC